ncbi:MAG: flagellin FliC [Proteobacteria bacterium]|nr:flagellin FliC [Pseudomonadota bacterium]
MGIRINTNIASVNAQRQLRGTQAKLSTSFEQLASGRRINKSADDAAGLAISESLNSSVRSYMQSGRNAQDGISFIQVAEGGMSEVANMVTRIRELSVQAASDTVGQNERSYLDREAQQMKLEIERIANSTKFNGQTLLNGQGSKLDFQVGVGNDEFLDRISYDPGATDVTLSKLGLGSIDLSSKSSAQNGLNYIDDSINVINSNRSVLGSLQNRLGTTIANNEVAVENFQAAKSRILDADMASVSSDLARETVKTQASTSVLAQANMGTQAALKLIG